jgi:hypothetical protein
MPQRTVKLGNKEDARENLLRLIKRGREESPSVNAPRQPALVIGLDPPRQQISDDFEEIENPEVGEPVVSSHTLILEEMQPLYFFNTKGLKDSDSLHSQEDRQIKIKEASTPCFIGSPVNDMRP